MSSSSTEDSSPVGTPKESTADEPAAGLESSPKEDQEQNSSSEDTQPVKKRKTLKKNADEASGAKKIEITSADMRSEERSQFLDIAPECEFVSLTDPWIGRSLFVERLLERLDRSILRSLLINSAAHPRDIEAFLTGSFPNLEDLLLNVGEHSFFEDNFVKIFSTVELPKLRKLTLLQFLKWCNKPGEAAEKAFPILKPILKRFESTLDSVQFLMPHSTANVLQIFFDTPKVLEDGDLDAACLKHLGVPAYVLGIEPQTLSTKEKLDILSSNVAAQIENDSVHDKLPGLVSILFGTNPAYRARLELVSEILHVPPFDTFRRRWDPALRGSAQAYLSALSLCRRMLQPMPERFTETAPLWYLGLCVLMHWEGSLRQHKAFKAELEAWTDAVWGCIAEDCFITLKVTHGERMQNLRCFVRLLRENPGKANKFCSLNGVYNDEPLWCYVIVPEGYDDEVGVLEFLELPGLDLSLPSKSGQTMVEVMLSWQRAYTCYKPLKKFIEVAKATNSGKFNKKDRERIVNWYSSHAMLTELLADGEPLDFLIAVTGLLEEPLPYNEACLLQAIETMASYSDDARHFLQSILRLAYLFPKFKLPTTEEEMKASKTFDNINIVSEYSSISREGLIRAFSRIERTKATPDVLLEWRRHAEVMRILSAPEDDEKVDDPPEPTTPSKNKQNKKDKNQKCISM